MLNNYDDNCYEIKNQATLTVEVCGRKHCIESNKVELKKVDLVVIKRQNTDIAFAGDCVTYTIVIRNKCKIDLYNLEFGDKLSKDLKYIRGSFKVNGRNDEPCYINDELTYKINKLRGEEETTITFEAEIK